MALNSKSHDKKDFGFLSTEVIPGVRTSSEQVCFSNTEPRPGLINTLANRLVHLLFDLPPVFLYEESYSRDNFSAQKILIIPVPLQQVAGAWKGFTVLISWSVIHTTALEDGIKQNLE